MRAEITLDERQMRAFRLWTKYVFPSRETMDTPEGYFALLNAHFKNCGWAVVENGIYEYKGDDAKELSRVEHPLHTNEKFRLYCRSFGVTYGDGTKSDRRLAYDDFLKSVTPEEKWPELLRGTPGQSIPNGQLYGGRSNSVTEFFGFEYFMWDYSEEEIEALARDRVYALTEKLCRDEMVLEGIDPDEFEAENPDVYDEYMHGINVDFGRDEAWFEQAVMELKAELTADIAISTARFETKIPEPVEHDARFDNDSYMKQWNKEAMEEWSRLPEPAKGRE